MKPHTILKLSGFLAIVISIPGCIATTQGPGDHVLATMTFLAMFLIGLALFVAGRLMQ